MTQLSNNKTMYLHISRIYLSFSILMTVLMFVFDRSTLVGQSAVITNVPTFMADFALLVCFVSVIDIFVNDILPDKYVLSCSYNYRNIIYMSLSLISFSISIGMLSSMGMSFVIGRLWLDSLIAAIVAFLDIFERFRCRDGS